MKQGFFLYYIVLRISSYLLCMLVYLISSNYQDGLMSVNEPLVLSLKKGNLFRYWPINMIWFDSLDPNTMWVRGQRFGIVVDEWWCYWTLFLTSMFHNWRVATKMFNTLAVLLYPKKYNAVAGRLGYPCKGVVRLMRCLSWEQQKKCEIKHYKIIILLSIFFVYL